MCEPLDMADSAMPALFLGHGNPMNAIETNAYTEAWRALGRSLPRPRAVLAVSAHWYVPGARVTAVGAPRTIHDFGGFPRELYEVRYPAPGDRALAARVVELLAPTPVQRDEEWGLDHGTWSVLRHVYPEADVPVVQLAIDDTQTAAYHHEVGRRLQPLRDEGVLVVGSGNVVHNLHAYGWGRPSMEPFDWALRFETQARDLLARGEHAPLVAYEGLGRDAHLSAPTPDHFLPLLYVMGLRRPDDAVSFPVTGWDGGSISMLSVQLG
jgi:4,5-DOPA dioxygenase extradiol